MNLYDTKTLTTEKEQFEQILQSKNIKIERIVSFGHPTPKGEWYDQDQPEWVSLLEGSATILFKNDSIVEMKKGDHIIIQPHQIHRVEKVTYDTIWLVVFY